MREAEDVGVALDQLERLTDGPIGIFGESMGGAAAVFELARRPRPRVRALATDGTFDALADVVERRAGQLGVGRFLTPAIELAARVAGVDARTVRPVDRVGGLAVSMLFLQGDEDHLVPPGAARRLAEKGGAEARHSVYAGGHDEPRNAEMQDLVLTFFDRELLQGEGLPNGAR